MGLLPPRGPTRGFSSDRTELHFNHLAENNIFGIVPLAKVLCAVGLGGGCSGVGDMGRDGVALSTWAEG